MRRVFTFATVLQLALLWHPNNVCAQGLSPVITSPAATHTVYEKDQSYITATVTGADPKSYQWFLNGTNLPAETNFAVFFRSVDATNAGTYSLVVSNSFGSTSATIAALDVQPFRHNKLVGWPGSYSTIRQQFTHYFLSFDDVEDVSDVFSSTFANFVVLKDGSILNWGFNDYLVPPIPLTNITSVIALYTTDDGFAFGLTTDGRVLAWNQTTNYVLPATDVVRISINLGALDAFLMIKADGTLQVWQNGQLTPVLGLSNVVAAVPVIDGDGVLALRNDGQVIASGEIVPDGLTNVVSIAAAGSSMFAIKSDGTLVEWNNSGYVSVPDSLTNVVAVSADSEMNILALQSDGSVVAWGTAVAQPPPQLTNAITIRAGPADLALVSVDRDTNQIEIISQIYNENAIVGGSTRLYINAQSPTPMHFQWSRSGINIPNGTASELTLQNIQLADAGTYSVSVSNDYGSTLTSEACLHVFPTNLYVSESGPGYFSIFVPPGLSNVVGVSGMYGIGCAVEADGTVVQWGGDFAPTTDATNVAAIACGVDLLVESIYGLRKDGTIANWGYSDFYYIAGQRPPVGLRHVTELFATDDYVLARKSDGTVVSWGTAPPDTSSLTNIQHIASTFMLIDFAGFLDKQGRPIVIGNFPPPPDGLSNLVDMALSSDGFNPQQGLGLKADGSVVCWGDCGFDFPNNVTRVGPTFALDQQRNLFWFPSGQTATLYASNVVDFALSQAGVILLTTQLVSPTLTITPTDTNVVVQWGSSSSWILETKQDLSPVSQWITATNQTVNLGSITPGGSAELPLQNQSFFRLRLAQ